MTFTGMRRATAVFVLAAAFAGCGGGSDEPASRKVGADAVEGVGLVRAGSTAQFADCRDWRRGSVDARRATIRSLRDQLTPQRSATAESALSDEAAYRLFEKTCSSGIADTLRLYKLYARAQPFAPFASLPSDSGG